MNYLPKSKRGYTVSVAVQDEKAGEHCKQSEHFWRPIVELTLHPNQWQWTCSNCGIVVGQAPAKMSPHITLKELEEMVDSSCRVADQVIEDDQSVRGELWMMRSALWMYWPYKFHCIYHVLSGNPLILLFSHSIDGRSWKPIPDTDTYRSLLIEADKKRLAANSSDPIILLP